MTILPKEQEIGKNLHLLMTGVSVAAHKGVETKNGKDMLNDN